MAPNGTNLSNVHSNAPNDSNMDPNAQISPFQEKQNPNSLLRLCTNKSAFLNAQQLQSTFNEHKSIQNKKQFKSYSLWSLADFPFV